MDTARLFLIQQSLCFASSRSISKPIICPRDSGPRRLLSQVRRVEVVLEADEVLLDAPRRDEAVEDRHAPGLVVCAARARTTERLLPNNGTRALLVVVDVAGRVAQSVGSLEQSLAVLRESILRI